MARIEPRMKAPMPASTPPLACSTQASVSPAMLAVKVMARFSPPVRDRQQHRECQKAELRQLKRDRTEGRGREEMRRQDAEDDHDDDERHQRPGHFRPNGCCAVD